MTFQETHLANDCNIVLKPYNCISKQGAFNRRQHGGVAIYLHDSCPFQEIDSITVPNSSSKRHIGRLKAVTIANIYIPGSIPLNLDDLCKTLNSLPKPAIIVEDSMLTGTTGGIGELQVGEE